MPLPSSTQSVRQPVIDVSVLQQERETPFDLSGAVAVITGSARGLGRAAATALARHGASVVMFDTLGKEVEKAAAQVRAAGGQGVALEGSVSESRDVARLVEAAGDLGQVSIVVNCAGIMRRLDIDQMTVDDLQALWDINVSGTVAVTQRFLPGMMQQGYGKIVNVGSLGSVTGLERRTGYATTKGAVAQYTVSLASEVGAHGVRANVVAPGYVDTEMAGQYMWESPETTHRLLSRIPLGRFAQSEDLEGTFVFLASPASDYVTGQVLLVDGGWTCT